MKVFVVGGTGAIGGHAVPALVRAAHTVTALARTPPKAAQLSKQRASPIMVSMFDRAALTEAFKGHDAVINGDQMMITNEHMNTPAPIPLPASLKQAVTLWLLAIGAGLFETLLVVANVLWGDGNLANGESLNAGVAVRLVIFVAMTLVALQLRLGKNWARWTIGILLGVFGLLSLVIQPVSWLMEGHIVSEAFAHLNLASAAFMLSRAVHMVTVVAATALMFMPTSNTFFRAQKRSGQWKQAL